MLRPASACVPVVLVAHKCAHMCSHTCDCNWERLILFEIGLEVIGTIIGFLGLMGAVLGTHFFGGESIFSRVYVRMCLCLCFVCMFSFTSL